MLRARPRSRGGSGSGAAPPFSPADIADLAMWYDAADTATITESGGAISQWSDKSGNTNDATQGSAPNQPTTGGSLNGLNAITFGTNKRFSYPLAWAIGTPYDIFVVDSVNSGTGTNVLIDSNGGGDGNNDRINMRYNGSSDQFRVGQSFNDLDYNKGSDFTAVPRIWLNARGNPTWTLYENGVSRATKSEGTLIAAPLSNTTIGWSDGSGGLSYDGIICEIVAYTRSLSTAEKNQVGNYLGTKWGITWTDI